MSSLPPAVLTELLNIRFDEDSLEQLLGRYLVAVQKSVLEVDDVSVTLMRGGRPFTASFAGERAKAADELQYQRGRGPCVDAAESGEVLVVTDMRTEARWPEYAARVTKHGILSAVSVPLPLQTDLVGALNWYGLEPGMAEETVRAGVEVAGHVAVALSNAVSYHQSVEYADQMRTAMLSRAAIEQAKGVIMAQNRCTSEVAFEILRTASMGRNVKLRDLAREVVERQSQSVG